MAIPSCTAELQQIVRDDEYLVAELGYLFYGGDYDSRAIAFFGFRPPRPALAASDTIFILSLFLSTD